MLVKIPGVIGRVLDAALDKMACVLPKKEPVAVISLKKVNRLFGGELSDRPRAHLDEQTFEDGTQLSAHSFDMSFSGNCVKLRYLFETHGRDPNHDRLQVDTRKKIFLSGRVVDGKLHITQAFKEHSANRAVARCPFGNGDIVHTHHIVDEKEIEDTLSRLGKVSRGDLPFIPIHMKEGHLPKLVPSSADSEPN
ncbi:MAG: hypothetical protein KDI46_08375 [Alphaproteobacteria bacterium]|nr:hypothetical protein [Alphaproteobacteria bacterium]